MHSITLYLGLDVHKDSITIAVADPGPKGEIRPFGTITNDVDRLEKALTRIRKAHPGAQLEVAYEAGPCGFVIARRRKNPQDETEVTKARHQNKRPCQNLENDAHTKPERVRQRRLGGALRQPRCPGFWREPRAAARTPNRLILILSSAVWAIYHGSVYVAERSASAAGASRL